MSVFSDEQIDLIAGRSRALGDTTRVRILAILARGEQAVGQIADAAGTQQSTVSKHLQVLFHAGLVQRRRDASAVIYGLASDALVPWMRVIGTTQLTRMKPPRSVSTHDNPESKAAQRRARE